MTGLPRLLETVATLFLSCFESFSTERARRIHAVLMHMTEELLP